jgi:uncharacterized protein YyaL (SSP411 family)
VTVNIPLGGVERRLLEVIIQERGLAELLAAVARIYADRRERFGGAAGEAYDHAERIAAALNDATAEVREEYAEVLDLIEGDVMDGADEARKAGL